MLEWISKLVTKAMEDSIKIQAKKDQLNATTSDLGQVWDDVIGYHALIQADLKDPSVFGRTSERRNKILVMHTNAGFALKAFINLTTKEVKFFPAVDFEED